MYGALQEVATRPAEALAAADSLVGFGMCPEGIEQNPIVYAAMTEWSFRCAQIPNMQHHVMDLQPGLCSLYIARSVVLL